MVAAESISKTARMVRSEYENTTLDQYEIVEIDHLAAATCEVGVSITIAMDLREWNGCVEFVRRQKVGLGAHRSRWLEAGHLGPTGNLQPVAVGAHRT